MKWSGRRESENFEDRRGMSTGGKTIVGGGIIGIVILLLNVFGGENAQMLTPILEQMNQGQGAPTEQRELTAKENTRLQEELNKKEVNLLLYFVLMTLSRKVCKLKS